MNTINSRRRASQLDRSRILEAAIEVARREGTVALSMARVGAEVGAGVSSLYYHVRNRDELIQGIVDRAGESVEHPDPSSKPEQEIENILLAFYDCLRRETWLVPHLIRAELVSKAVEPLTDRALLAFHQMGLSEARSFHALAALLHYTFGEIQVVAADLERDASGVFHTSPSSGSTAARFFASANAEAYDFRELFKTTVRRYLLAVRIETSNEASE
ncbi:MAG: helix-turn-helix domain-containing protein [Pseudomonadota bacterium]